MLEMRCQKHWSQWCCCSYQNCGCNCCGFWSPCRCHVSDTFNLCLSGDMDAPASGFVSVWNESMSDHSLSWWWLCCSVVCVTSGCLNDHSYSHFLFSVCLCPSRNWKTAD